jgi:hypothetical protein
MRTLPSSSLTVPDVQISRFRFFMEELCSRGCSDGRSGLPAEGGALGVQRTGSWGTDPCDPGLRWRSSTPPRREVIRRVGDRAGNIASHIGDQAEEVFAVDRPAEISDVGDVEDVLRLPTPPAVRLGPRVPLPRRRTSERGERLARDSWWMKDRLVPLSITHGC